MSQASTHYAYNGRVTGGFPDQFDPLNRGFRLGDGFFESVRIIGGKPAFWEAHHKRLTAACGAMHMDMPVYLGRDFLLNTVMELVKAAEIKGGGRLRITIFREGEGTYFPEGNRACCLMEIQPFFPSSHTVADKGLSVGVYRSETRRTDGFSKYKILGNHLSIGAAAWAIENRYDEALLINEAGYLTESTSGNLFIVDDETLHTPSLSDGCVGGVMRMAVINTALSMNIPVFESQLTEDDVVKAEEVFITNAIRGIVWVRSFRHKRYFHKLSDRLIEGVRQPEI